MKLIDIPPVWLLLCILVAWGQSRYLPIDWGSGATWTLYVGGGLVVGGIVLAVLAVLEMRKAKTTVIPHMEPDALVTTGVFSFTRNPIYLADVMILLGLILWWGAIISLILVPLFLMMIERRFIIPEEARLRAAFGEEFDAYVEKVHRWL